MKGETLIQPVYIGTSDVESAENFAFDVRQCARRWDRGEVGRGERGELRAAVVCGGGREERNEGETCATRLRGARAKLFWELAFLRGLPRQRRGSVTTSVPSLTSERLVR